jgi:hypothetical protein
VEEDEGDLGRLPESQGRATDEGVRIEEDELMACGAVYEIHEGHPEGGYAINVKKLPKDVTVIHVENSW